MKHSKNLRSLGTHDGQFHADEVTACAFLLMFDLIDEDKIIRTRDIERLRRCEYVCDVGGEYDPNKKLFDHHQAKYHGKMSSAGMILLFLKEQEVINQNEYDYFNDQLVYGVDADDNGREPLPVGFCSYSDVVGNFMPIPYEVPAAALDEAFMRALHFAVGHISRLWERYHYAHSSKEIVARAMRPQKNFLLFDKSIPWMDLFFELGGINHPAEFVIMPSGQHWNLRGIPPSLEDKLHVRHPLPQKWAGLLENDLKVATGINGAIFCHKGRFISVWETKEDALAALEYTMGQEKG